MKRIPRTTRTGRLAVLLLHLLVVGMGPLADARLHAAAERASAHVKDATHAPSRTGHNHAYCLICRSLQTFGSQAPEAALGRAPEFSHAASVAARRVPPSREVRSSLGARAPPAS
jgi:hypothetical protein